MRRVWRYLCSLTVLLGTVAASGMASGQQPPGLVRLVVPYASGGGSTDLIARLIAPYLSKALGQPVIVENHPGASGTVGLSLVARAKPDGTTLGVTDSAFVTNPSIFERLPYDAVKDFTPIVLAVESPQVLLVNPAVPAETVAQFVDLALRNPGRYTYASAGNGTAIQIAAEQFRLAAGLDLLHVPYRGLGPAVIDTIGGQVTMVFGGPHTAKPYADSGQLRALAITGARRSAEMPDVPSFAEASYPSVDMVTSNGIVGPAGMAPDLVSRINAAANDALTNSPELKQKLGTLGLDPVGGTPQDFAGWIGQQIRKWQALADRAGRQRQ